MVEYVKGDTYGGLISPLVFSFSFSEHSFSVRSGKHSVSDILTERNTQQRSKPSFVFPVSVYALPYFMKRGLFKEPSEAALLSEAIVSPYGFSFPVGGTPVFASRSSTAPGGFIGGYPLLFSEYERVELPAVVDSVSCARMAIGVTDETLTVVVVPNSSVFKFFTLPEFQEFLLKFSFKYCINCSGGSEVEFYFGGRFIPGRAFTKSLIID